MAAIDPRTPDYLRPGLLDRLANANNVPDVGALNTAPPRTGPLHPNQYAPVGVKPGVVGLLDYNDDLKRFGQQPETAQNAPISTGGRTGGMMRYPQDTQTTPVRRTAANLTRDLPFVERRAGPAVYTPDFSSAKSGAEGAVLLRDDPNAVAAGPQQSHNVAPVFASRNVMPPSALDANAPLPSGVRQFSGSGYVGRPGTNDVIYEGRGAHGERAFSNNQFDPLLRSARGRSANDPYTVEYGLRSGEINDVIAKARASAAAAAVAAAQTPTNAKDATERMKAIADVAATRDKTQQDRALGTEAVRKAAQENLDNNPYEKSAADLYARFVGNGIPLDQARAQAVSAARAQYEAAGYDPDAKDAPAAVREGGAGLRRLAAQALNTNGRADAHTPWDRTDEVTDPEGTPLSMYEPVSSFFGDQLRFGRRSVYIDPNDPQTANLLAAIRSARARKSRAKPLVSDRT